MPSGANRALSLLSWINGVDQREQVALELRRFTQHVMPILRSLRAQTIHNDLNPHNILAVGANTDQIAGVIDFGDMLRTPLIQELATAAAYQPAVGTHPMQALAHIA
jgi:Ser/Thr protein kinase RdoA (MazF antagonist)